jgi:hypothetical protein
MFLIPTNGKTHGILYLFLFLELHFLAFFTNVAQIHNANFEDHFVNYTIDNVFECVKEEDLYTLEGAGGWGGGGGGGMWASS